MNKILFLFFSFFALQNTAAQSTLISGKLVIDDIDYHVDLDNFSIINLNTDAKTTVNSDGIFSIKVNLNDELLFKNEGIEERVLKISENMISKGFVTVHLNVEVIELAEATINPLKKNLKDNIKKDESDSEKINKSLGINEEFKLDVIKAFYASAYLKKYGGVGSVRYENIIGILDQFTNDAKYHKKKYKEKSKEKYVQIEFLKDFFTTYYFVNDLKIPEGRVLEFLDYCYMNFNFKQLLKNNNTEEILYTLNEQAPIYLSKITSNE